MGFSDDRCVDSLRAWQLRYRSGCNGTRTLVFWIFLLLNTRTSKSSISCPPLPCKRKLLHKVTPTVPTIFTEWSRPLSPLHSSVISSTLQTQHTIFVSFAVKTLYTQHWRAKTESTRDPFNDLDQGVEGIHFPCHEMSPHRLTADFLPWRCYMQLCIGIHIVTQVIWMILAVCEFDTGLALLNSMIFAMLPVCVK